MNFSKPTCSVIDSIQHCFHYKKMINLFIASAHTFMSQRAVFIEIEQNPLSGKSGLLGGRSCCRRSCGRSCGSTSRRFSHQCDELLQLIVVDGGFLEEDEEVCSRQATEDMSGNS